MLGYDFANFDIEIVTHGRPSLKDRENESVPCIVHKNEVFLQQVSNQKNVCVLPGKGSLPPQRLVRVLGQLVFTAGLVLLLKQSPKPVEQLRVVEDQVERALQDLANIRSQSRISNGRFRISDGSTVVEYLSDVTQAQSHEIVDSDSSADSVLADEVFKSRRQFGIDVDRRVAAPHLLALGLRRLRVGIDVQCRSDVYDLIDLKSPLGVLREV